MLDLVSLGGGTSHGGLDEFFRHPRAGVPHRRGCGGAGGEAAAVAAAGEGGREGERGEEVVGVSVKVFKVLCQNKVLQRFVEQIIIDDTVVWTGFNSASRSRTSKRPALEVFRRDHLARAVSVGNVDIISASSLFWQTLALVYMRQSLGAFG